MWGGKTKRRTGCGKEKNRGYWSSSSMYHTQQQRAVSEWEGRRLWVHRLRLLLGAVRMYVH